MKLSGRAIEGREAKRSCLRTKLLSKVVASASAPPRREAPRRRCDAMLCSSTRCSRHCMAHYSPPTYLAVCRGTGGAAVRGIGGAGSDGEEAASGRRLGRAGIARRSISDTAASETATQL
eukprot:6178391-Pleurochrysis_carterae.AAC.4